MNNIVQEQCLYCHQKLVLYDGCYDEHANQIALVKDDWTLLAIGVDQSGNVVMRACGDDYTEDYYPKYCPECGRKLKNKEENENA